MRTEFEYYKIVWIIAFLTGKALRIGKKRTICFCYMLKIHSFALRQPKKINQPIVHATWCAFFISIFLLFWVRLWKWRVHLLCCVFRSIFQWKKKPRLTILSSIRLWNPFKNFFHQPSIETCCATDCEASAKSCVGIRKNKREYYFKLAIKTNEMCGCIAP